MHFLGMPRLVLDCVWSGLKAVKWTFKEFQFNSLLSIHVQEGCIMHFLHDFKSKPP